MDLIGTMEEEGTMDLIGTMLMEEGTMDLIGTMLR